MSSPQDKFNLDISGVAGFFGGDVTVQAMKTVHMYEGRKWVGWYNSPGSLEIARVYGQLAKSKLWDSLYPGPNHEPAELFELDGKDGPVYRGVHSGTVMPKTGHAAHLILHACKAFHDVNLVPGRRASTIPVSIVRLEKEPKEVEQPTIIKRHSGSILAFIPMFATVSAAAGCAAVHDWFCFSMILLGMFASGISCFVIGSGTLYYTHPKPAEGVPPGDGILEGGSETVILIGPEGAVNAITRGAFSLRFSDQEPRSRLSSYDASHSDKPYHAIGICSLLLTVQFLAQLIVLPQGSLYGQILFLSSLVVSWAYNSYLCSISRWEAQQRILANEVLGNPVIRKYLLPTRTAMVVFVLMILANNSKGAKDEVLRDILAGLLPNKTPVWEAWRKAVWPMVHDPERTADATKFPEVQALSDKDQTLLMELLGDANDARLAYKNYRFSNGSMAGKGMSDDPEQEIYGRRPTSKRWFRVWANPADNWMRVEQGSTATLPLISVTRS